MLLAFDINDFYFYYLQIMRNRKERYSVSKVHIGVTLEKSSPSIQYNAILM